MRYEWTGGIEVDVLQKIIEDSKTRYSGWERGSMVEPDETRKEPYLVETWHPDAGRIDLAVKPEVRTQDLRVQEVRVQEARVQDTRDSKARTVGSPLPAGSSRSVPDPVYRAVPPQGRALSTTAPEDQGMQRAMGVLKQAMPFVQKLLPLLDGNIASVVANLFAARPHITPTAPPVDLTPLRNQLTEIHEQHQELRTQVIEQNSSLKRVEDQLDMVREATDRNTLEQQELIEDLKAVGNKVNLFALLLFAMLIVSLVLNVMLFLHIKQVFP